MSDSSRPAPVLPPESASPGSTPAAAVPIAAAPDAVPADGTAATPPKRSVGERILRAGVVVILAHLILKAMSLVLSIVLKREYGLGVDLDAYNLVFSSILATVFYAGEEALGPTFLATFMAIKDGALKPSASLQNTEPLPDPARREFEAWELARTLATVQTILLTAVILLCILFPEQVVSIWINADGSGTAETIATRELLYARSVDMLRLMAGGLIGWSLGSLTYLLLNSYKIFFVAALGDAMLKIGVLVAVVGFSSVLGYQALSLGVLIGGLLKLGLHLWGLRKVGFGGTARSGALQLFQPKLALQSPGFRMFLVLLMPLLVGILMGKVRDWFYTDALTHGPDGVLSARNFGKNMFDSISQIVPYALSIAMYPFFCEMIDRGDRHALAEYLTKSTRFIGALFIALAILVFVLAEPLTALLYFTPKENATLADLAQEAEKVAWIALSLRWHIFALPLMAVELFQLQAYFSDRRLLHSQVIGVSFAIMTILLIYLGTRSPWAEQFWAWQGRSPFDPVALIMTVGGIYTVIRLLKVLVLGVTLRRYLPVYPWREMAGYFVRLALMAGLGSLGIWALVGGVARLLPDFGVALDLAHLPAGSHLSRKALVAGLAISGTGSALLLLLAARLAGMTEFQEGYQYARIWYRSWKEKKAQARRTSGRGPA